MTALIRTAEQISRLKTGKYREKALEFLEWVDDERIFCLALLMDALHEGMALTRVFDREQIPAEDAVMILRSFLRRIAMLFVDREILKVGFAAHALGLLKASPLVIYLPGGRMRVRLKKVGSRAGLSEQVVERCFGRMAAWVRLVREAVLTEFPAYNTISAFRLFSLTPGNEQGSGASLASDGQAFDGQHSQRQALRQLSAFFAEDASKFEEAYRALLPIARAYKDSSSAAVWNMHVQLG